MPVFYAGGFSYSLLVDLNELSWLPSPLSKASCYYLPLTVLLGVSVVEVYGLSLPSVGGSGLLCLVIEWYLTSNDIQDWPNHFCLCIYTQLGMDRPKDFYVL